MMGPSDIRDLVSSLFIMLNKKMFVLFRIEFLVVLVTILFLAMFIMDIFRRHIHSSIMRAIFSVFDAVSDSIVIYLLGAMQTAPFKNQLFPVWALVLVIFRYSVDFISGYGVPDRGGRRFTEWRNVVKLLGSAFLNWTRGSRFAGPLWSLWALQILRSWYRLHSRTLAFNSVWHGASSELISEYMRKEHDPRNWKPEECNPVSMDGYKYLVYGESVKLQKPRYVLRTNSTSTSSHMPAQGEDTTSSKTITRSSVTTLDKIWGCPGHLLRPGPDPNNSEGKIQGKDLKDLSLAFALSRMLRCRLEDVMLQQDACHINQKLVKTRIIEEKDAKRAFRIMELQLAFVNDYFNTRYPMVFWSGLRSLFFSLLQSVVTLCVVLWLSVDIRKVYKPPQGELVHLVQEVNVDMIITWVFMFFMIFKEIWEMVTYLLSDWTRLLLVCLYVNREDKLIRNPCMECLILSFFKHKIIDTRWHGLIDQYVFVQSFDDRPKLWNWVHKITTGMVPKKDDGAKLGSAIKVPECIGPAVLHKLRAILDYTEPADPNRNLEEPVIMDGSHLPKVIVTFNSERKKRYGWACFDLQTSADVILVWNIATSLCEIALAKTHGVDLSKPGFLCSLLSCLTCCCSSKPYLINVDEENEENKGNGVHSSNHSFLCSLLPCFKNCCSSKSDEKKLSEELKKRYIIANSLSRYCAYLLVSKPDLIPDSFLVPNMVFQKTVKSARDDILKGCDSLESRYNKLCLEAYKVAEDSDNVKKGEDVVKQGAMLGKALLDHEGQEGCWEILAGVWTELIIHIAPTWNAEAHKKCLESGGEFITNIWALLWQCGIEKSSLWPTDDASENNAPTDLQDNDVGNNNINTVEEMQQAGTDTRNHQIRIEAHKKVETVETKETKASNLRTGPRGIEILGSLEIEEVMEDVNVQTGITGQTQNKSEVKVEDILPAAAELAIDNLPIQQRCLYEWYIERFNQDILPKMIAVKFKEEHFHEMNDLFWLEINELYQMSQKDALDVSLIRCWTLMEVQRCKNNGIDRIGFLDPGLVNESLVNDKPKEIEDYLFKAILKQERKTFILLPYNYDFHWILLIIQLDLSKIVILDSLSKPQEKIQNLIDLLNRVFVRYCQMSARHIQDFLILTNFPCMRQGQGNNLCGFYVCTHMHAVCNDQESILQNDVERLKLRTSQLLPHEIVDIQEQLAKFINEQVIHSNGEFHDPTCFDVEFHERLNRSAPPSPTFETHDGSMAPSSK